MSNPIEVSTCFVQRVSFNAHKSRIDAISTHPLRNVVPASGEAEVKQVFSVKEGKQKLDVAGCRCTKGLLVRHSHFRVYRNDDMIHEGMTSQSIESKDGRREIQIRKFTQ